MFYLIGLGLNAKSLSLEALEICRNSSKIYLENYTVEFPYSIEELEHLIGKKIIPLTRLLVENEKFADEAGSKNIVLLVYGSPLAATTHSSLILKCKKEKIDFKILENSSIFDAVCETGLQIYKFGKTASLPKFQANFKPSSFLDIIKDNKKISAHSLLLVDIGLSYSEALKQLQESSKNKLKIEKMIVCSRLGTNDSKICYDNIEELYGREIYPPFCFIIPSNLHFLEEEFLEQVREK